MRLNARVGGIAPVVVVAVVAAVAFAVVTASAQTDLAKITRLSNPAALKETAPDTFKVNLDTSKGLVVIEVHREWAPLGADRFYNLVKAGFYDDCRFFRVIDGFMAQFGINGNPGVMKAWRSAPIPQDDPVKQSNKRGFVVFATGGPRTRTTQLFINFGDNSRSLDGQGFSPFGQVVTGMDIVDKIYNGYGEGAPSGRGPEQGRIQAEGNAYLNKDFPKLDFIKTATIAK